MAMEPDLDYRYFEPAVSTFKRCDTCGDLQADFMSVTEHGEKMLAGW